MFIAALPHGHPGQCVVDTEPHWPYDRLPGESPETEAHSPAHTVYTTSLHGEGQQKQAVGGAATRGTGAPPGMAVSTASAAMLVGACRVSTGGTWAL